MQWKLYNFGFFINIEIFFFESKSSRFVRNGMINFGFNYYFIKIRKFLKKQYKVSNLLEILVELKC